MNTRLSQAASTPRAGRSGARARSVRLLLLAAVLVLGSQAHALDLRFASENDVFVENPTGDDLYTFSIALELDRDPFRFSLRENAFTDREAGVRFDETLLAVGRTFRPGSWSIHAEGGFVHVGRGLLGEDFQNALHRYLGSEEMSLSYYPSSLHPSWRVDIERTFRDRRRFAIGPRFEGQAVSGLRSHALLGVQAHWRAIEAIGVRMMVGGRVSHASLAPLVPHMESYAPAGRFAVVLHDAVFVSWSYNEFGDRREHLQVGFWAPLGERGRADRESARRARLP